MDNILQHRCWSYNSTSNLSLWHLLVLLAIRLIKPDAVQITERQIWLFEKLNNSKCSILLETIQNAGNILMQYYTCICIIFSFWVFYNILHIIFLFCTMIFNFYFLFSNLRSNCLYNESLLFMSLEYIPIAVLNALLFGVISCWYFVSFKCVSFLFILASYTKQGITNQIFVIRLQDCYWNKIRKKK